MHNWFAKSSKYIFNLHLQRYPYIRCKLCTHRCECVSTKNTSFIEERISDLAYYDSTTMDWEYVWVYLYGR